jgi:uncharacterized protein
VSNADPVLFLADWMDVAFVHFRVDPGMLQPRVPFELDLFGGDAYVSIVSFTQRRLRPTTGGRVTQLLAKPLAEHEFLNLRTYVKHDGDTGIYFLAEWIPNRLAQLIGPALYGLPYRLGTLKYEPRHREVRSGPRSLEFRIGVRSSACPSDALSNFLNERFTAYTYRDGVARKFDVAHAPWRVTRVDVELKRMELVEHVLPFLHGAVPSVAHHAEGVRDVRISKPHRVPESHLLPV